MLTRALIPIQPDHALADAIGRERKGKVSAALYAVAIPVALVAPHVAFVVYMLVALISVVPDSRIERAIAR